MASIARKSKERLRYPEDRAAVGATPSLPLDEMRGKKTPNKLADPEVRGLLIGAAAFTTVEIAASIAGVAPSSIYDLRKRDPAFEERWQTARARTVAAVEMALVRNAVVRHNVEAQKFFLASHKPETYRPRSELEVAIGDISSTLRLAAERAREHKRALIEGTVVEVVPVLPSGNGDGNGAGGNGHEPT